MIAALRNFRQNQSGAALVEFSLLIPIMFPLFFGMTEYGRLIYQQHVAQKGVQNAARYLARIVDDTGCGLTSTAFSNAKTGAKTLAVYGGFDNSATPQISNWTASDISVSVDCETNTGAWRGENDIPLITVSTTFSYDDIGFLAVLGKTGTVNISAGHQEIFVGG